jgi:hypothetical protein
LKDIETLRGHSRETGSERGVKGKGYQDIERTYEGKEGGGELEGNDGNSIVRVNECVKVRVF